VSSSYGAAYEVRRSKKKPKKTARALQTSPTAAFAPRSGSSGGKKRTYVLHSTSNSVGTSTAAVYILQTPAAQSVDHDAKQHQPAASAAVATLSPSLQQQPPDDAEYAADFD
jgi:hypothetical protein